MAQAAPCGEGSLGSTQHAVLTSTGGEQPGAHWWVCLPRTDTVFLVARELSQVPKTALVEPLFLPSNLLSLFCRYLDKQTIHHLEAKME